METNSNKKLLLSCKGFKIDKFEIPAFDVMEGELVEICLWGGGHYFDLEQSIANSLAGERLVDEVEIKSPFTYIKHPFGKKIVELLYPTTVGRYIKKNAGDAKIANRIYELDYIKPNTKLNSLPGTPRKLLSLFSTFSKTNKIIFNLAGLDPRGVDTALEIVNEFIQDGGGAIWLNSARLPEFCDKYYEIKIDGWETYEQDSKIYLRKKPNP